MAGCEGGEHHLATTIDYFGCTPFMYSSDFPHEVNIESCKHEARLSWRSFRSRRNRSVSCWAARLRSSTSSEGTSVRARLRGERRLSSPPGWSR